MAVAAEQALPIAGHHRTGAAIAARVGVAVTAAAVAVCWQRSP